MALTAKNEKGQVFPPIPEGVHNAVCVGVVDLGTHSEFKKKRRKVLVLWELPEVRIDIEVDGTTQNVPRMISKECTLTLWKDSNLRKLLEGWRGKTFTENELEGFDLYVLLKLNCQVQVMHAVSKSSGNTYAYVNACLPFLAGQTKYEPEGETMRFSFEDGDDSIADSIPQWIEEKIQGSEEWAALVNSKNEQVGNGGDFPPDDDVPF